MQLGLIARVCRRARVINALDCGVGRQHNRHAALVANGGDGDKKATPSVIGHYPALTVTGPLDILPVVLPANAFKNVLLKTHEGVDNQRLIGMLFAVKETQTVQHTLEAIDALGGSDVDAAR